MSKSDYIKALSALSDRTEDKLLAMMDYYKVNSLAELTKRQVKEYFLTDVISIGKQVNTLGNNWKYNHLH